MICQQQLTLTFVSLQQCGFAHHACQKSEKIKIEKDIEKRCSEHYEKICQDIDNKFTDVENKVDTKCSKQEVEAIVNDKLKTLSVKGDDEDITEMVQSTVTDIVDAKIIIYNNNNIYLKSNIHKMFSRLLYTTHMKCSI